MIFRLGSESSNADTADAEENSMNEENIFSTIRKKFSVKKDENQKYLRVENGDIYSTVQKRTPSNGKISINLSRDEIAFTSVKNEGCDKKMNGYPEENKEPIYATIDKKTRKLEDASYSDEEDELMAQIEACEDLAMEALDTAALAVTGESIFMKASQGIARGLLIDLFDLAKKYQF